MPLDFCDAKILGSKGVDISYHPWVSEMEEGIVNDKSVWSGGVERGQVSVSGHASIEVGVGEGSCVKGSSIDGGVLRPSSLQCDTIS